MSNNTLNQFGQIGYGQAMDVADEGQPHANLRSRRALNPLNPQVTTVTIGGTAADGDYTITVVDDQTGAEVFSVTFDRADSENNAAIATALFDLIAADDSAAENIYVATNPSGGVVSLAFLFGDKTYTVTTAAPGGATATVATTATGGLELPFGRFLLLSGAEGVAFPGGSAAATDFRGVSVRSLRFVNEGSPLNAARDVVPVGADFALGFEGQVAVRNNSSTAAVRGGLVYVVRNTAGGQELGMARADADSTNTVALAAGQAYWADSVPGGEIGWVELRL